jgi:hypothetical protein
VVDC